MSTDFRPEVPTDIFSGKPRIISVCKGCAEAGGETIARFRSGLTESCRRKGLSNALHEQKVGNI
jgi:hypothetical protein